MNNSKHVGESVFIEGYVNMYLAQLRIKIHMKKFQQQETKAYRGMDHTSILVNKGTIFLIRNNCYLYFYPFHIHLMQEIYSHSLQ